MSYAIRQDMIDRFGEKEITGLTDTTIPASGTVNDDVLTRALTDADALINGYLASRYTLPLTELPEVLTRVACDLARYFLARRPTDEMTKRYDQSIAWLRDVSTGKVTLGVTATQQQPVSTGGPQSEGNDRVFGPDTFDDY
jgi:phage gp36-like protein